ncbi:MAG: VWA domain-containing protein [Terracidiphilus sp.]|jgi:VWFA-related protein
MRFGLLRLVCLAIPLGLAAGATAGAQQMPPSEPPLPLPKAHVEIPTLRVTANEVLVPTLVEKPGGGVVYGLKPQDFVLEDNGVPQKIRVQEEMDTAPVALVVAVEQGGVGVLEFNKLAKLGPLLDLFLSDGKGQAALVGFDSKPHLIRDFTHSSDVVNDALKHLRPGDGGDAILDTASYAVDLLQTQPKEYRRVLLLISEERDHGSKHTKPAQLIQKIGQSDVLVLSVSFTPARAELGHDIKDSGEDRTMSMISSLFMLVQAFKKNVTKEIAHMSGGEYHVFTGDKAFESRVVESAQHARNRYLITFSPSDPTPGLHTIRVRLAEDYGARIVARANYWREAEQ